MPVKGNRLKVAFHNNSIMKGNRLKVAFHNNSIMKEK